MEWKQRKACKQNTLEQILSLTRFGKVEESSTCPQQQFDCNQSPHQSLTAISLDWERFSSSFLHSVQHLICPPCQIPTPKVGEGMSPALKREVYRAHFPTRTANRAINKLQHKQKLLKKRHKVCYQKWKPGSWDKSSTLQKLYPDAWMPPLTQFVSGSFPFIQVTFTHMTFPTQLLAFTHTPIQIFSQHQQGIKNAVQIMKAPTISSYSFRIQSK